MTVEQDIWHWIENFVEKNHEFYDYKFPPCPYARTARLRGTVDVAAWHSGSYSKFINKQALSLINDPKLSIRVLAFPARLRWYFWLHHWINKLNRQLIPQNYYAQYGLAVNTTSQYPGVFAGKPYFIVIINRLSDVLDAHGALVNTDYYKSWSKSHYHNVVTRRQQAYDNNKGPQ